MVGIAPAANPHALMCAEGAWRRGPSGAQVKRLRKRFHAFDDLGALFNDPLHGDEWVEAWQAGGALPSLTEFK